MPSCFRGVCNLCLRLQMYRCAWCTRVIFSPSSGNFHRVRLESTSQAGERWLNILPGCWYYMSQSLKAPLLPIPWISTGAKFAQLLPVFSISSRNDIYPSTCQSYHIYPSTGPSIHTSYLSIYRDKWATSGGLSINQIETYYEYMISISSYLYWHSLHNFTRMIFQKKTRSTASRLRCGDWEGIL